MRSCCWILVAWLLQSAAALAAPPAATDPRLVVELVAKEPDILTPTGIAVDEKGRVWVVENNTHFRPKDYQGHPSDRILIFEDYGPDGLARKRTQFADGFKDAMSITLGNKGEVYLATRSQLLVLKDTDGDGKADEQKVIVKLETTGNYPHNGLSGFAFDALGWMYFGFGENLGVPFKVVGSDGAALAGTEGGKIYRCRPDGSKLSLVATGFWNPYHMAFDAFGRLFAVDNDPDSRPPCRLLHVIQGGDYGYKFRNGRRGLHPFTAWNGELPGTLPMVSGTGEAPSGIVAYESTGLPKEYVGSLLTTSWGDHVVERFVLKEKGASFTSEPQVLVKGDMNFRPVGIAVGPDGAVYLSDWVDKSYPVHGKGRIWRIRMKEPPKDDGLRVSQVAKLKPEELVKLLGHGKIEIRMAAGEELARQKAKDLLQGALTKEPETRTRMQALWALALMNSAPRTYFDAYKDRAPELRGEACRLWGEHFEWKRLAFAQPPDLREDPSLFVQMQYQLHMAPSADPIQSELKLTATDPFLFSAAMTTASRDVRAAISTIEQSSTDKAHQAYMLGLALALRRSGDARGPKLVPILLEHPNPAIRRTAIQWVGEEGLKEHSDKLLPAALKAPTSRDLLEAYIAAREYLDDRPRKPGEEPIREESYLRLVNEGSLPAPVRAWALRMVRPDHPELTREKLVPFLLSKDETLQRESFRTLSGRGDEASQQRLRFAAVDFSLPHAIRHEALAGLARSSATAETQKFLTVLLAGDPDFAVGREALRSLRGVAGKPEVAKPVLDWSKEALAKLDKPDDDQRELAAQVVFLFRGQKDQPESLKPLAALAGKRPAGEADWRKALEAKGDAAAGARLFFHPEGPKCFTCHKVDGRGGNAGPELSKIAASLNRDKLIDSILAPSKEIAPQFVAWAIGTRDGKVTTGVILHEDTNHYLIGDAQGKAVRIMKADVEEKQAAKTSLMPDNLHELMTVREFRDLLAYLSELR